jgi:hypothetical protein
MYNSGRQSEHHRELENYKNIRSKLSFHSDAASWGGKSASEKSQPPGGKESEKSHVHGLGQTPFEASTGQTTQYYDGVVKDKRTGQKGRRS